MLRLETCPPRTHLPYNLTRLLTEVWMRTG